MKKVIDLTRKVIPGEEKFKLKIKTYQVKEYLPGFEQGKRDWHIMQDFLMCSHIGTHVEAPYHHLRNGIDAADLPLDKLMGQAIILDFSCKDKGSIIEKREVKEAAGRMRKNDIVIIRTDWSKCYYTPVHLERPSLSLDAIKWLVQRGMKCIGIDASGIEPCPKSNKAQLSHHFLFKHNIPIIEELDNLSAIKKERFSFIGLPLKISGLDASPIRAIAILEK